ncbi:hypothetical protein [Candidatus Ulvibacter alkanivorans]|uniref:hypothetical protein n=1 Tax=Candidatus Ulvibacter alkanivorans TaxID=2267620 RepID=UPI000DF29C6A|nr:hypothetical protein [Candidatus Ulvibacter alkanivorans]
MRIAILIISIFFFGCNTKKSTIEAKSNDSGIFLITKLEELNNWNIIYAKKETKKYKIITGKILNSNNACETIKVGKKYNLDLNSRKENVPEINGIKIKPVNNIDIECYTYDIETDICIEPDNDIYDLYHTNDINGLCYLKKEE